MPVPSKINRCVFVLCLLLALGACAAPAPEAPAPEASAPKASAPKASAPAVATAQTVTIPPASVQIAPKPGNQIPSMSDPLPPEVMPAPARINKSVAVDLNCKTDADCTVKNVGNCCGYYPACVNKRSQTDPAAVQAQCQQSGMASVCGFREISLCRCARGTCMSADKGAEFSADPVEVAAPQADPAR